MNSAGRGLAREISRFLGPGRMARKMYDLVLTGGTVLDPASGLNGPLDIAVEGGQIALVAAGIDAAQARRVIDVAGKTVTPGLIDLHAHVLDGVAHNGVHPDIAGVRAGV